MNASHYECQQTEQSERVVASGTPLFDVSKGDELELVIDYLTQEAILIRPGNKVVVSDWGGATPLSGTVRYVEPGAFTKISTLGVEEQRVNVIVDLDAPPPELGAGFRITAAIVYWESDNLLKIPTSAIFRSNQMWHTFVVRDDEARLQALEIGHRNDDFAQLLSGVDNGDVVILYPSDLIEHGTLVSSGQ